MSLADAIATFLRQHYPSTFCSRCLAKRLESSEPEILDALRILALQDARFVVSWRICRGCSSDGDFLGFAGDPPQGRPML